MRRWFWRLIAGLTFLACCPGPFGAQADGGPKELAATTVSAPSWVPPMSGYLDIFLDNVNNRNPAIAYNSKHDEYLVVWWNDRGATRDISARRISGSGKLLSSFIVAHDGNKWNWLPAVAYSPVQDEYLVAYAYNQSSSNFDIWARRVKWDGSSMSPQFAITLAPERQWYPAVAYNSVNDEYLVVYENYWASDMRDIAAQRVRASDGVLLSWRNIASAPGTVRRLPAVAYNASRNEYCIAYTLQNTLNGDIYARITSANMGSLSAEHHLVDNGYHQDGVALASGPDEYLAVWEDGPSTTHRTIYGRRITGGGALQPYIPIADQANQIFTEVAVGYSTFYGYLVAWRDASVLTDWEVRARYVKAAQNTAWQTVFPIDITSGHQKSPAVGCNRSGDCLVAYEDEWGGADYDLRGRLVMVARIYIPLVLKR
jgi:hypothetical protein